MWLLVAREPRADAAVWHGRRWLAAADALAWPLLWVLLLTQIEQPLGIVGPMVVAGALFFAVARLHRAVWANHRYWFTTWRWGKPVAMLIVIGLVLKLALGMSA